MRKTRAVSIVDVARKAGLSQATVSRVLNKSGYYSAETLEKVEAAIRELGYAPNRTAQSLKGKFSQMIGVIIPDISNVFYTALARSMLGELEKNGYETVLCVHEEDAHKDLAYLKLLEQKNVDGVLYTHPSGGSNSFYLRKLVEEGMAIIEVNRQREKNLLDAVLADNVRGVQQVIHYLHGLGHQKIAMISGSLDTTTGAERLTGYQNALAQLGIALRPELLKIGQFNRSYGEAAMLELLDLPAAQRPTAVFATSNRLALGALYVLGQKTICIPQDLSVVAFDDAEWMAAWNPPICTVDIAIDEMSRLAVNLLLQRIGQTGERPKPVTYHLETSLIVRQSCSAVSS